MVIGSEVDKYFPSKSLETTHTYYPDAQYEVLPDMCHDMMLDPDRDRAAKLVLDFMDKNI